MLASRVAARTARVALAAPRLSIAATRGYAEPAKSSGQAQNTRPPIEVFGVDGTYASALVRIHTSSMAREVVARADRTMYSTPQPPNKELSIRSPRL